MKRTLLNSFSLCVLSVASLVSWALQVFSMSCLFLFGTTMEVLIMPGFHFSQTVSHEAIVMWNVIFKSVSLFMVFSRNSVVDEFSHRKTQCWKPSWFLCRVCSVTLQLSEIPYDLEVCSLLQHTTLPVTTLLSFWFSDFCFSNMKLLILVRSAQFCFLSLKHSPNNQPWTPIKINYLVR